MPRKSVVMLFSVVLLLVGVIGSSGELFAQAGRAIILGRVTDATSGVVPGAEIKVIQTETNIARTTETNNTGDFEVPGLFPGVYRVEAALTGFKKVTVDNVRVQSAQRVEVNIRLEVGETTDSVTVVGREETLDTASADVRSVIDTKMLSDLPIGQGHATYVFLDSPGVSQASSHGIGATNAPGSDITPYQRAGTAIIRYNGAPGATTAYTIDGTPNTQTANASSGGPGSAFNPNTDVVQEVRVQTNAFDASVGHSAGSAVDLTLKAGTNDYHGTAFMDFRPPDWSANLWAANKAGTAKADYTQRRWGFTGGGPVWLGPLYDGKDKTFFYSGFERWSKITGFPSTGTVPVPEHLTGDFSDLLAISPSYQLYNPYTARLTAGGRVERDPFPNNIIPANLINPTSKVLSTWFPAPNTTGTIDGQQNISYLPSFIPQSYWNTTHRLDHNLSHSHKLFGRVLVGHTILPSSTFYGTKRVEQARTNAFNRDFAVNDVWTVSPTFVADFRASVMRFIWRTDPTGAEIPYDDIGFSSVKGLFDTEKAGYPSVSITGYPQLMVTPGSTAFVNSAGSYNINDIRTAAGHFTKLFSNHSLKFGVELRQYINNRGSDDNMGVAFGGGYTNGPLDNSPAAPHGGALADFLLGTYSSATITVRERAANLSPIWSLYLQDDWKVTHKLKLNLGIRYDREGPATERFDRALSDFAFGVDSPIASEARANYANSPLPELPASQFNLKGGLVFAGGNAPRTIYEADNNNIAPRIGLVYELNEKTVIRTGYGIYYIPFGQRFVASTGGTPGYTVTTYSYSSTDGGLTLSNFLDKPFTGPLNQPTGSSLGLATNLGQGVSVTAAGRDLPNAYTQRWEFSVQRLIGGANKLDVRYVGTRTLKMPLARNINIISNEYLSTSPERDQATIDYLSERFPNPFRGVAGMGGSLATSTVVSRSQLLLPYPQYSSVSLNTNQGFADYHALQVELVRRFAAGLMFQTSYVFSKTMDGLTFLNAADPVPYRSISDSDRTHVWRYSSIWELPFGKGRRFGTDVSGVADYLISGWQVQGITYINSGFPLTWGNIIFRGNLDDIPVKTQTAERMFNTDAGFEKASAKQLGSNVRTFPLRLGHVRTSTETNTDISVIKNTYIGGEKYNVQFRMEAYNIFNQHFYGYAPNTTPTNTLFGVVSQATGSRTLQMSLRLKF